MIKKGNVANKMAYQVVTKVLPKPEEYRFESY